MSKLKNTFKKSHTILETRLQLIWIGRVLVLYTGHLLHAFSAFDDLNESLPRRAASQFASSWHERCTSGDWRVVSCRLFLAAVLIECGKSRVSYAVKSKSSSHGRRTWVSLLLLFWLAVENLEFRTKYLVGFDWSRTGAEHTRWPFTDSYLISTR